MCSSDLLLALNKDAAVFADVASLRPSALAGVTAAIDLHGVIDDITLRDMMLRNIRVVLVDRQPQTLSTHAVLIDRSYCGTRLAQTLLRAGHRHIAVIERGPSDPAAVGELLDAVRQAAHRFDQALSVRPLTLEALPKALGEGVDAVICADYDLARSARTALASAGIGVPERVSILAMGLDSGRSPAISGMAMVEVAVLEVTSVRKMKRVATIPTSRMGGISPTPATP